MKRIELIIILMAVVFMFSCTDKNNRHIKEFTVQGITVSENSVVYHGASHKVIGRVVFLSKKESFTLGLVELDKTLDMGISSLVDSNENKEGIRIIPARNREAKYNYIALIIKENEENSNE